jgi:hypothetical protein
MHKIWESTKIIRKKKMKMKVKVKEKNIKMILQTDSLNDKETYFDLNKIPK